MSDAADTITQPRRGLRATTRQLLAKDQAERLDALLGSLRPLALPLAADLTVDAAAIYPLSDLLFVAAALKAIAEDEAGSAEADRPDVAHLIGATWQRRSELLAVLERAHRNLAAGRTAFEPAPSLHLRHTYLAAFQGSQIPHHLNAILEDLVDAALAGPGISEPFTFRDRLRAAAQEASFAVAWLRQHLAILPEEHPLRASCRDLGTASRSLWAMARWHPEAGALEVRTVALGGAPSPGAPANRA